MLTTLAIIAVLSPGKPEIGSVFDKNVEGWTVVTYPEKSYSVQSQKFGAPHWVPLGGGFGGCIQIDDVQSGSDTFLSAPPKFRGDVSAFYGGTLTYELNDTDGNDYMEDDAVVLKGGGLTLVYESKTKPTTTKMRFTKLTIPLSEEGWTKDKYRGKPASAAEMRKALSKVTELSIRSEYHTGKDDSHLDNVVMTRRKLKGSAKG